MKLYSGPLSLFSRKVEIALGEKGIAFEHVMVPFTQEVRKIVDTALERAVALLTRNRAALERAAKRLLEKETLDEQEVKELLTLEKRAAE